MKFDASKCRCAALGKLAPCNHCVESDFDTPEPKQVRVADPKGWDEVEDMSFTEFLVEINRALPKNWQLDGEEWFSAWELINHIQHMSMRAKNEEFQKTLWDIREELREQLLPQVKEELEVRLREQLEYEHTVKKSNLESQIKSFNTEKQLFYDKERQRIMDEFKRGSEMI